MKKNISWDRICYYSIILLLIFTSYARLIYSRKIEIYNLLKNIKNISSVLILIITLILFCLEYRQKKIKREDIKIFLEIIFFSLFLRNLYAGFFIVIISKFIGKNNRLKYLLLTLSFFYILVLCLNSLGLLEFNNIQYGIRNFKVRNSLGFNHPNTTIALVIPIFSLLYYLYYPKYKKIVVSIILIIGKIIFDFTQSRASFLLLILLIILILIKDKYIEKFKFLFLIEGFFLEFFTIYLPFYFKNTILNKFLSERLNLFYYYLSSYKLTLFGSKGIKEYYDKYPLDNTYLVILFENGIVGFILLIILIFGVMYILFKNKDYKAVRIFSIILMFGFTEYSAFVYYFNVIFFIIGDYIFKSIKLEKINENKGESNEYFDFGA